MNAKKMILKSVAANTTHQGHSQCSISSKSNTSRSRQLSLDFFLLKTSNCKYLQCKRKSLKACSPKSHHYLASNSYNNFPLAGLNSNSASSKIACKSSNLFSCFVSPSSNVLLPSKDTVNSSTFSGADSSLAQSSVLYSNGCAEACSSSFSESSQFHSVATRSSSALLFNSNQYMDEVKSIPFVLSDKFESSESEPITDSERHSTTSMCNKLFSSSNSLSSCCMCNPQFFLVKKPISLSFQENGKSQSNEDKCSFSCKIKKFRKGSKSNLRPRYIDYRLESSDNDSTFYRKCQNKRNVSDMLDISSSKVKEYKFPYIIPQMPNLSKSLSIPQQCYNGTSFISLTFESSSAISSSFNCTNTPLKKNPASLPLLESSVLSSTSSIAPTPSSLFFSPFSASCSRNNSSITLQNSFDLILSQSKENMSPIIINEEYESPIKVSAVTPTVSSTHSNDLFLSKKTNFLNCFVYPNFSALSKGKKSNTLNIIDDCTDGTPPSSVCCNIEESYMSPLSHSTKSRVPCVRRRVENLTSALLKNDHEMVRRVCDEKTGFEDANSRVLVKCFGNENEWVLAIIYAVAKCTPAVLKALLDSNANVNGVNDLDQNSLHIVALRFKFLQNQLLPEISCFGVSNFSKNEDSNCSLLTTSFSKDSSCHNEILSFPSFSKKKAVSLGFEKVKKKNTCATLNNCEVSNTLSPFLSVTPKHNKFCRSKKSLTGDYNTNQVNEIDSYSYKKSKSIYSGTESCKRYNIYKNNFDTAECSSNHSDKIIDDLCYFADKIDDDMSTNVADIKNKARSIKISKRNKRLNFNKKSKISKITSRKSSTVDIDKDKKQIRTSYYSEDLLQIAEILVNSGIEINKKDVYDKSPFQYAMEANFTELANFLNEKLKELN